MALWQRNVQALSGLHGTAEVVCIDGYISTGGVRALPRQCSSDARLCQSESLSLSNIRLKQTLSPPDRTTTVQSIVTHISQDSSAVRKGLDIKLQRCVGIDSSGRRTHNRWLCKPHAWGGAALRETRKLGQSSTHGGHVCCMRRCNAAHHSVNVLLPGSLSQAAQSARRKVRQDPGGG
jgi:hypothetical protein